MLTQDGFNCPDAKKPIWNALHIGFDLILSSHHADLAVFHESHNNNLLQRYVFSAFITA
jgi:hypothetical protein